MSDPRKPWEPDPQKLGNWASMFDPQARDMSSPPAPSAPADQSSAVEAVGIDLNEYKPWQLQRGRSRPTLMLGLRRFDVKSGQWHSWLVAYPSLYAIDTIGDRMLSLDFGNRLFAIEGRGLDLLADHLQQGTVVNIIEYAASVWPSRVAGPIVTAIHKPNGQ